MVPNKVATARRGDFLWPRRYQSPSKRRWSGMRWGSSGSKWLKVHSTMIRPSSRSKSCNWVSKRWEVAGVSSRARKTTIRRATWEMTGRSRIVRGKREEAKEVASGAVATVAWSIEAIPLVKQGWFGHVQFTKESPQFQDAGIRVIGSKSRFGQKAREFRRNSCTGATAPPMSQGNLAENWGGMLGIIEAVTKSL